MSDADLLLVFLAPEGIFFLNRTDDPWYRATVRGPHFDMQGAQHDLYEPDEAASPMACVQRFQYCDSNKQCGRLASFADAVESAGSLFHRNPGATWSLVESGYQPDAKRNRFEMFQFTAISAASFFELLNTLGPSSLLSSQHMLQGIMGPLPNTQWQQDVSHWFAIRMASLQAAFLNSARGPSDEAVLPYVTRPRDQYQREMCKNQVRNIYIIDLFFTFSSVAESILLITINIVSENPEQ